MAREQAPRRIEAKHAHHKSDGHVLLYILLPTAGAVDPVGQNWNSVLSVLQQ